MILLGQFRTSVRSIRAVAVSPKALSGEGPGGAGAPPGKRAPAEDATRALSKEREGPRTKVRPEAL